jgi:putative ABC transport system permease protein
MPASLHRKLLRDLWLMKGQVVAICLVMACGAATFTMSLSTLQSLREAKDKYCDHYRFAHVFTHLKRAPLSLAAQIGELPGVSRVQTRVVVNVSLDVPGMSEPPVGHLISIPEGTEPELNRLHLRDGRYLHEERVSEVLVNESFAEAHGMKPGDFLSAIINGRKQRLQVVGIALSPEFIYPIREGDIVPDNKRYGILWMGAKQLRAAFDMDGAFNDVCLTLMPGASEPEVLRRLDQLTERYGGLGAFGRREQTSNKFIENEIAQLRGMGLIAPLIVLSVSAFLLNIVLSRLVGTQREQIAALKAFGYSRLEIGWHYLQFVLVLVVAGVSVGTVVGAWLGRRVTELYSHFFRFPTFEYLLGFDVIVTTLAFTLIAGVLGTLGAVVRAVRLPPAEAMRPEPPAVFRRSRIERLHLKRLFSPAFFMIIRQLERRPVKPLLTSLGIAVALAVFIVGSFMEDTVNYVINFQFAETQRYDVSVAFVEPVNERVVSELAHLPGVLRVEPFRGVPVRLRFGHHSRRLGILGLPQQRDLFRLLDNSEREVPLPTTGLLLSSKLGELLDCRVGDRVTVEVLEGKRPVREVLVSGFIADFSGLSAYMDRDAVHEMMREAETASGAFLTVDSNRSGELYTRLKQTPQVAGVTVKAAALESFRRTIAENLLTMKAFNVLFATLVTMGVVYNGAQISLAERSRELATLRVIGFTRGEISRILLGELALLTGFAIPLGLGFGYLFAWMVTRGLDTETYRFPLMIGPQTYASAVLVTLGSALGSALIVRRQLDHLDLVSVLKSRE